MAISTCYISNWLVLAGYGQLCDYSSTEEEEPYPGLT